MNPYPGSFRRRLALRNAKTPFHDAEKPCHIAGPAIETPAHQVYR
jgi:hypothetical protein